MSEGKGQWVARGLEVAYSEQRHSIEGPINVIVAGIFSKRYEQNRRLTAWLNHIAPDGFIPPAPEKGE